MTGQRIQRRRTKGWRKPEGAVIISRPSPWGNPFTRSMAEELGYVSESTTDEEANRWLTLVFDDWLTKGPRSRWWFENGRTRWEYMREHLPELEGATLVCWCPVEHERTHDPYPCHGNVLLRMANEERR